MRTILILDDDPSIISLVEHALRNAGYQVLAASNGTEGLRMLKGLEAPPDAIVADIVMPEIDGMLFNTLVRLMPGYQLVPFIYLTALANEEEMLKAYMGGFDDYITKPFSVRDLLMRVEAQIRRMAPFREMCRSKEGRMEGSLSEFPISRLLSYFSLTGRSGSIEFTHKDGNGRAVFEKGTIARAEFAGLEGNEAIARLLHLKDVAFKLECRG